MRINEFISYTMGDGRKVAITFIRQENDTKVIEAFEAETTNSIEMQKAGWQAFLDNFKNIVKFLNKKFLNKIRI